MAGWFPTQSGVFDASGQNRHAIRLNFTLNNEEKLVEAVR